MKLNKQTYFSSFLIVVLTCLIYSNSFHADFQYDDQHIIVDNPDIKNFNEFNKVSTWFHISYRAISMFSFAINYHISGMDNWSYHLVNLIIHLLAGIIAYLLTLQLLALRSGKGFGINLEERISHHQIIAIFTALIFVSHPIQTQAVTYISQRMTSMAALFYITAVYFYLRARLVYFQGNAVKRSWAFGFLALLLGAVSVSAKQTAISFPLAFLLVELVFIRNIQGKVNFRLVSIIGALIITGVMLILLGNIDTRDSQSIASRFDYLCTQLRVLPAYFRLVLFPYPYGQNIDHFFNVSVSFGSSEAFGLIINAAIFFSGFVLWFRKQHILSFSIIWVYITLSIESSIFPIKDVMVEHRMYLPMFGVALFIAHAVYVLAGKRGKLLPVAILSGITVFFGVLTYQRNAVWRSPLSLWEDAVRKSPEKARPNNNLGYAWLGIDEPDSALQYFEKAIALKPDYVEAHNNKGLVLYNRGDYERAVHAFQKALLYKPDYAPAINNMGLSWSKLNEFGEARRYMKRAFKLDPNNPEIPYNLGVVYEKGGLLEKAEESYLLALAMNPAMAKAAYNLGNVYHKLGDMQNAIRYYEICTDIMPGHAEALNNLGNVWYLTGDTEKAIAYYKRTLSVNPDHKEAKENLEFLLRKL